MSINLSRNILIHVCRDKTLSYRTRDEAIFNGVAIPVYSVNSKKEARELIVAVGRAQYDEHPLLPGQVWYKITLDGSLDFQRYLEVDDLVDVAVKLDKTYQRLHPSH